MHGILKKYRAFVIGLVITLLLMYILHWVEVILIPDDAWLETTLIFSFWWIVISLVIHNVAYFKENKHILFTILGMMALLIIAVIVDELLGIPDNPLTLSALVIFWLGVLYLISPRFFSKYRFWIIGVYALILIYFVYVRLFTRYLDSGQKVALILFFIPIPILALLWVFEQWKWFKTMQSEKTKAELALLKSQVNPHFFFNTLNNLYTLTVQNAKEAPDVILKLSDVMRYTIYQGKKETVPLEDEISYLENYLALHDIRYHKNVEILFDHDIEEGFEIAPLLLIVLLENAIKHGVETLADNAYIKAILRAKDREIDFYIENNFDGDEKKEEGIGLQNLSRRLELIYPKRHALDIVKEKNVFKAHLNIRTV